MNKNEFMESLRDKLAKLNKEDREDAINYYWEYFEEAGFGDESDVTRNVGKPEDIAAKIIEAAEYIKENNAYENKDESVDKTSSIDAVKESATGSNTREEGDNNEYTKVKDSDGNSPKEDTDRMDLNNESDTNTSNECNDRESGNHPSVITALDIFGSKEPGAFDSIDIKLSTLDVIIRTGDEFGIYLNCKEKYPEIKRVGSRLVVRDGERGAFSNFFNFNLNIFNKRKEFMEITIPRDKELMETKCRLDSGKLSIFAINSHELDLKTDMGSMELVSVSATEAKFGADLGNVSVKESHFTNLVVKSSTGAVNIKNSNAADLRVSTDAGYISLDNTDAAKADLNSDAGYIKLIDGNIGRLSAKTDAGLIKLDGTDVGYTKANSDAGSITAKLPGVPEDYCLDLSNDLGVITVDGRNCGNSIFNSKYRESAGNIPVELSVDTGKISVIFLRRKQRG